MGHKMRPPISPRKRRRRAAAETNATTTQKDDIEGGTGAAVAAGTGVEIDRQGGETMTNGESETDGATTTDQGTVTTVDMIGRQDVTTTTARGTIISAEGATVGSDATIEHLEGRRGIEVAAQG